MSSPETRDLQTILTIAQQLGISTEQAETAFQLVSDALSSAHSSTATTHIDLHEDPLRTTMLSDEDEASTSEVTDRVLDRYEDLGELGRGGMGEVRLVRDRMLGRTVAMKILREDKLSSGAIEDFFLREARVEAGLQHPGVPPIYDLGRLADGRPWYTMKRIGGRLLSDAITSLHAPDEEQDQPQTALRDLMRVYEQVCMTIGYAHESGVIHRDLKPENIMLGDYGEVLVVDWGVAAQIPRPDAVPKRASIAGTPVYMAPEQAEGLPCSLAPTTDVYGLGAVLFEILCGVTPFSGPTANEVLAKVKAGPTPSPRETPQGKQAPPELLDLCEAAMERKPSERLQSATQLAERVRHWLDRAEKRDRGLSEVQRAETLASTVRQLKENADALWLAAAESFAANDGPSSPAWKQWRAYRDARAEALDQQQRSVQLLQGALAHSPSLREAHLKLSEHYSLEAMRLSTRGHLRQSRAAHVQAERHRQHLSPETLKKQDALLEQRLKDVLWHESIRRGPAIGREDELDRVRTRWKNGSPVLGIYGAPGVGKSHLLIAAGLQLRNLGSSVLYCDLVDAVERDGVLQVIAGALSTTLPVEKPLQHLASILSSPPRTILLDNIDRCSESIIEILRELRTHVPSLQAIATSRAPLDITPKHLVALASLGKLAAVELLIERGLAADPELDPNDIDHAVVREVIDRLDRIPLAIELAAARLSALRMNELRDRLLSRLDLIQSGPSGRGLNAAMQMSWDALSPALQAVFAQASVFRGGFDASAAEAVLEAAGESLSVMDALEALQRQSLLQTLRTNSGRTRYRMLESVRTYAEKQLLQQDPSATSATTDRHAQYFAQLSRQWADRPGGEQNLLELENLIGAARNGGAAAAARCCLAASAALLMQGPIGRGINIVTEILERGDLDESDRQELTIVLSRSLRTAGRMREARVVLERPPTPSGDRKQTSQPPPSRPTRSATASQHRRGTPLTSELKKTIEEGLLAYESGEMSSAQAILSPTLVPLRNSTDQALLGRVLITLGTIRSDNNGWTAQESFLNEAIELAETKQDRALELSAIGAFGLLKHQQNRLEDAVVYFSKAAEGQAEMDNHAEAAENYFKRGTTLHKLGNSDQAAEALDTAIEYAVAAKHERREMTIRGARASLATSRGEYITAHKLACQALEWQERVGDLHWANITRNLLAAISIDRGELDAAETHIEVLAERAPSGPIGRNRLLQRVNEALLLRAQGHAEQACQLLEELLSLARKYEIHGAEGLILCNLGDTLMLLDEAQRAKEAYLAARSSGGANQNHVKGLAEGALAVIYANEGEIKEAQDLLASSREIVGPWRIEAARLEARTAEVELLAGDIDAALHHLHIARSEEEAMALGPQGALRQIITRVATKIREAHLASDRETSASLPEDKHELRMLLGRLAELGTIEQNLGVYHDAEATLERAAAVADALGEARERCWVWHLQQNLAREQGQHQRALLVGTRALALAEECSDLRRQTMILTNLGITHQEKGDFAKAKTALETARKISSDLRDERALGLVITNLAHTHFEQGDYRAAHDGFAEAVALFGEIGCARAHGLTVGNLGCALLRLKRFAEAEKCLNTAIEMADRVHPIGAGSFRSDLAEIYAQRGQTEDAQRLLKTALQQVASSPLLRAQTECQVAVVAKLSGDEDGAREAIQRARQIASTLDLKPQSGIHRRIEQLQSELH